MKSINFYLLRHGKTEGEAALNGVTDVTVATSEQRRMVSAWLGSERAIAQLVSSPLQRCYEFSQQLASQTSLPVITNSNWQEMNFGKVDGIPFSSLSEQWPMLEAFWQQPAAHTLPEAESLAHFYQRVSSAWQQLVAQTDKDTLLVTHGGVIRMILASVLGVDWGNPKWFSTLAIANASVTHIQVAKYEDIFYSVKAIGVPLTN